MKPKISLIGLGVRDFERSLAFYRDGLGFPVHNYTDKAKDFFAQRPMSRILALNEWLKKYCAENKIVYLDYFPALADDKGLLKKELADDGLHPNDAGFKIMAPLAEAAIAKAMK